MSLSKQFFLDIGAKIADRKCFGFAADKQTREFLASYRWDHTGLQIPTVSSFRDIGAHLNLSSASNGKTLSNRMQKATAMTKRLAWLPISTAFKERVVRANILPAGLYAVESSSVNQSALNMLRAAIANAIGPKSARANPDMVFNCTSCSGDLDPLVYILVQRVTALKRIMAKFPDTMQTISDIIHHYNSNDSKQCNHTGPVAMLVQDLKDHGATLSNNVVIQMEREADVDVLNMPWQHLKKAVADIAIRKRNKNAAEQRTHLQGLQEVDTQMVHRIVNSMGDKEKKVYRHISSGGAWAENHLEDIGLSNGVCRHCGKKVNDISHVLWQCGEISKHRVNKELCNIDPDALPCYIKHGIPAAMTTNVKGPYWCEDRDTNQISSNENLCNAIGLATGKKQAVVASCKQQEIHDTLANAGIDSNTHNARQAFQGIKSNKEPPHLALPHKCTAKAPQEINVYSDGSWIFPIQQYLGLGGAGVWWPGRDINVHHFLSPAEKELGHFKQQQQGLLLYTPIGGYSGSSTRTELAAAILALAANGPIHLGTDSQAFLDTATAIIANIRKDKKQKRNWQLVSDGDLWYHFEQSVKAKGYKAFRVSKVKGHVQQSQVDEGIYTQADKDGNDCADHAADLAVAMHGGDIISMGRILHKRYLSYIHFMINVAHHIVEGYLIHKQLLDRRGDRAHNTKKPHNYSPLKVKNGTNTITTPKPFATEGSILNFRAFSGRHKCATEVWHFLQSLTYYEVEEQQQATTWLELYLLYRIKGYGKPVPDRPSKARARAHIQAQINEFKKAMRGVVQRAIYDEDLKAKFKPHKITNEKFLNLGIKGKFPAICCTIEVDNETAQLLEYNLITLGHRVSAAKVQEFREGITTFIPIVPVFKGRAGWDSNIKVQTAKHKPDNGNAIATLASNKVSKRELEQTQFKCPHCNEETQSNKQCFQLQDLDKVNKCKKCKVNVKVRDWMCSCAHTWHLCEIHRSYCSQQSNKKPLSNVPSQCCKRMLGPLTHEQLQEIDTKRMRRTNQHVLPPAPNILSAKLRERFAYLF